MSVFRVVLRRSLGFNFVFNNARDRFGSGRFTIARWISYGSRYDPSFSDIKASDEFNQREYFEIPARSKPMIIGPAGVTINQITGETRTKINITDQTVEIAGSRKNILAAKDRILEICRSKMSEEEGRACEIITIPTLFIKHIIGVRGAIVKQISEKAGVIVNVSREIPGQIELLGKQDGIFRAKKIIDELCKKVVEREENYFQKPSLPSRSADITASTAMSSADSSMRSRRNGSSSSDNKEVMTIPPNKVRLIIGLRGSTVERIQNMTGAVINASRDGSGRVEVTGSTSSITAAKEEINNVLVFGDNTKPRLYYGVSGQKSEVITVPQIALAKIIGANGVMINKIMAETEAVVTSNRDNTGDIQISGTPEAIARAKEQINRIVDEVVTLSRQHKETISVPNTAVSLIVGPDGATVRKIEEQTGTVIDSNYKNMPGMIDITGPKTGVDAAKRIIDELIGRSQFGEEEIIQVPVNSRATIVGSGGSTVRQIQEETGTRINISASDAPTVAISGSRDGIEAAKRRIEEVCQGLSPAFSSNIGNVADHKTR